MTINPNMPSLWMSEEDLRRRDEYRRTCMYNADDQEAYERPMKDITPKPDPVVKREAKMISGPIKRAKK